MENLEFRGKRKSDGKWIYGDVIHLTDGRGYIIDNKFGACIDDKGNFINTEYPFVNEIDPSTACMYIGRKDVDGNKIYNCDILGGIIGVGLIQWIEKDCRFGIVIYGEETEIDFSELDDDELVVVGNVYDNYDMLR